ncbi:MAG: hypothetical protein Q7J25_12270 [Vicinamibacterales bacterium]|nr:hypothetical protein [Vicinamibacterales bacterium]
MLPIRYRSATGKPRISVTQVLTFAGRINTEWFTEESCWRGTAVHRLTEQYDRGESFVTPPGLGGYLDAYATFLAVVRPVYADIELKVQSDELDLGGQIDRVCLELFGRPGHLDLKTGPPYPWHGQQLAGYNQLKPTGARWCLYLRDDGTYRLKMYDDPIDNRRFVFDLATVRGQVLPDGDHWVRKVA